jgi:hypothetical protein
VRRKARLWRCARLLLYLLFAWWSTGCHGPGPTGPEPAAPPPVLVVSRPDLQARAESILAAQIACAGLGAPSLEAFPIHVQADWFMCGSVPALGCYHYTRISAAEHWQGSLTLGGAPVLDGVLGHEYLHLLMDKRLGRTDHAHTDPLWARCPYPSPAAAGAVTATCGLDKGRHELIH